MGFDFQKQVLTSKAHTKCTLKTKYPLSEYTAYFEQSRDLKYSKFNINPIKK